MVTNVPAGPAADAGMKAGDVITSFAGGEVGDPRELVRRVADAPVGVGAVDVVVQRDGKPVDLKVTLGRRELAEETGTGSVDSASKSASDLMGMTVAPLTPGRSPPNWACRARHDRAGGAVGRPGRPLPTRACLAGDVITEAGQQLQLRWPICKRGSRKPAMPAASRC